MIQVCGNFQHLEPINFLKERADWYVVVREGSDEGETKVHYHFAMRTSAYTRLDALKRAVKDKFPDKCTKNAWCIKVWKDDGYLRYMCKGKSVTEGPDVVYEQGLDIDTDKWHKAYYASRKLTKSKSTWLEDIVDKYSGQEWDTCHYEIFKEITAHCPCPTKYVVIGYLAKVRRALDKEGLDRSLWSAICDDPVLQ